MPATTAQIRYAEETKPPYDDSHGTPHTMVRRVLEFELPAGNATCEQTDYGHPGRFNPWEQRHIDAKLQPKTPQVLAAAEAIGALLD
jgi:hypothetical protein